MTALSPFLWLDPEQARAAVDLYTRVVPDCRETDHVHFDNPNSPADSPDVWTLAIGDRELQIMGNPTGDEMGFTSSLSLSLRVDDQAALDKVWDGFLAAGGHEMQCGWIVDPFGVQWQIVPAVYDELVKTDDGAQAQRVIEALWQMVKIDVAGLEQAARG